MKLNSYSNFYEVHIPSYGLIYSLLFISIGHITLHYTSLNYLDDYLFWYVLCTSDDDGDFMFKKNYLLPTTKHLKRAQALVKI